VPLFAANFVGMGLIVFVVGYFLSNQRLAQCSMAGRILIGLGIALLGTQAAAA